ncbi:MAG: heme b synthase [Methanohalobium sp.]|uniref:heme b synthase n=1 Tax=Methanohalobium sp. TaxID=2837493 RepID=UPI003979AECA
MAQPPKLIAWEFTKSCNLSCAHCRGASTSEVDSDELTTNESKHFIDEIADIGSPILILSGGEPLIRDDIFEIASYGTEKGLRVVMATNGTLVTSDIAEKLKQSGVQRVSISIDGATSDTHDGFRGLPGAFKGALNGIEIFKKIGIGVQINTTITKRNIQEIPDIFEFTKNIGAEALHIFMLVPTGRGKEIEEDEIPPEEYEKVLNWFYEQQKYSPIQLKATCAPQYFRVVIQREQKNGRKLSFENDGYNAMTKGCLGGTGFCFVSSRGEVYPCGYLPALAGDLRQQSFKDIWNNSKVFNDLRDSSKLKGKCGVCEYKKICGGCRARAYAETGDYLDEEPYCIYNPKQKSKVSK